MTRELTPGDRRELRSVVKNRFRVLRSEVKRRETEMKAEIEAQLVERYRDQDAAIGEAQREAAEIVERAVREIREVGQRLKDAHPELTVQAGRQRFGDLGVQAADPNRSQLHRALIAAVPDRIGDANLALDRQETDLLQELSVGALETDQAREFLASIPTVGELVPRARLREIEGQLRDGAT